MDIINAIVLGIVQGLTEFLPVSSSGHIEIVKTLIGEDNVAKKSMLMTVVLHFATALSTIIVFRKDLVKIFKDLFLFNNNESCRFSLKIIISMIPAAAIGFLFESEIESLFSGQLILVGGMLTVTGLLLLLADKSKETNKKVGIKESIIIGLSQAVAIIPGISRSGATISTSVLLGIDKEQSARFSFLMVVPLILGKMFKDILSGEITLNYSDFTALCVGFLAALITGLIACTWMISLVKNSNLKYFAYYCFGVGFIIIMTLFL